MSTASQSGRAKRDAAISVRVRQDLKDAIAAAASAEGRSASEQVEVWLELARAGQAGVDAMLGGVQPADAIRAMAELARQIAKDGDPSKDPFARDALIAGWSAIIQRAVPLVPPAPLEMDVADKREDARTAIRHAFKALKAVPADTPDPTPPPPGLFGGGAINRLLMTGGHMNRAALLDALQDCAYGTGLDHPNASQLIEPLSRYAKTHALTELEAAADALSAYQEAQTAHIQERVAAYRRGQALAEVIDRRNSQAPVVAMLASKPAGE